MASGPAPLPVGTLLAERFEIGDSLGRGGFAIAYRAQDRQRGDLCVVKELAPLGSNRLAEGIIDLEPLGQGQAHRLRQRFLEEAKLLQKLNVRGVLAVRAFFAELGTAYYVTEHLPGAINLEEMLRREGPFDPNGAMDLIYQLLETLEALHDRGILHRDIKPSNVLCAKNGQAYLIDFGTAREWHADATVHHTILFTPGYAPLEQLSERARRGPATDLYALCATAYHILTGQVPPSAAERAAGVPLTPLRELCPYADEGVAKGIEAGLTLRYQDRPSSVRALREIMAVGVADVPVGTLDELDMKLLALKRFSFDRRGCPACGELMTEPKPLRKGVCPVCREGTIRPRRLSDRLCPACRAGTLQLRTNEMPLAFCPLCRVGELHAQRKSLLAKRWSLSCQSCGAGFEGDEAGMTQSPDGPHRRWEDWRIASGRTSRILVCDGCRAQYDNLVDGRWRQISPEPREHRTLFPDEWARVAARLDPLSGDAECDACGADYDLDGEHFSLLRTQEDPFGFAQSYQGRRLTREDVRWLGVEKESPNPGFVCHGCSTEFDRDGEYLRLVRTEDRRLVRLVDEPKTLEDWHRIAQGLPAVHQEDEFLDQVGQTIIQAFEAAEIGFDAGGHTAWHGPACRLDEEGSHATLLINERELSYGGMLRKWRAPIEAIVGVQARGNQIGIQFSGERTPTEWEVEPVELTVHLKSGPQSVELTAENLAQRLKHRLEPA